MEIPMNKLTPVLAFLLFAGCACYAEGSVTFNIYNSSYVYNDENGSDWDLTQYTLTYIEDIFQPYFTINVNDSLAFRIGSGFLIPFNQESKILDYYPYVQTRMTFGKELLVIGSLDGNHNFPAPIMDPASGITPAIRVTNHNHITYGMVSNAAPNELAEYNPTLDEDTHGVYEYGGSLAWNENIGSGELYVNWQEMDLSNSLESHRERFDVGLIDAYEMAGFIPMYGCLHYWHNGGHETYHPIGVTENYTGAFGLRDTNFDILYMFSILFPVRGVDSLNVYGQAVYLDYHIRIFGIDVEPEFFVTDEWLNHKDHFISAEGDPYFYVPLYLGLNIYYNFYFDKDKTTLIQIGFVNGTYLGTVDETYTFLNLRNDQLFRINFQYVFDIVKPGQ